MLHVAKRVLCAMLTAALVLGLVRPAQAITLHKEEELAREFLRLIRKHYDVIEDPLVTSYVQALGRKLVATLPAPQFAYKFHVVRDHAYNAFAGPAGYIFVNSGLFAAMENEDELAGVLAHEISHVECRHISQRIERSSTIGLATLAGIAAGLLLGVGGAAAAVTNAVTLGSVATAQAVSLAYSREDETQADQIGLGIMERSGYSVKGMVTLLHRFRDRQWFGSTEIPTYLKTHPGAEERIGTISTWNQGRTKPMGQGDEWRFAMVAARLAAVHDDPDGALRRYGAKLRNAPQDTVAHYGYGLALAETGNRAAGIEQIAVALKQRAFDGYILGDMGRLLYLDGKIDKARGALEGAVSQAPDNGEAQLYLARVLKDQGQLPAAQQILETLVAARPDYSTARYQLGELYGTQGKLFEAHLNLGIYFKEKGDLKNSRFHLQRAVVSASDPEKRKSAEVLLRELTKEEREVKEESERRGFTQAAPEPTPQPDALQLGPAALRMRSLPAGSSDFTEESPVPPPASRLWHHRRP